MKGGKVRYIVFGIIVVLAAAGAVLLFAGKKDRGNTVTVERNESAVFGNETEIGVFENMQHICRYKDGFIFFDNNGASPKTKTTTIFWTFVTNEGEIKDTVEYNYEEGFATIWSYLYLDGQIKLLERKDDGTMFVHTITPQGEPVSVVELPDTADHSYHNNFFLSNGEVILSGNDEDIVKYDVNGKRSGKTKRPRDIDFIMYFYETGNDRAVIAGEKSGGYNYFSVLDLKSMTVIKTYYTGETDQEVKGGGEFDGYDFAATFGYGYVGFNLKENRGEEIINYTESNLAYNRLTEVLIIDKDTALIGERISEPDEEEDEIVYSIYHRLDPDEIENRVEITLAGVSVSEHLMESITDFNKKNKNYKIRAVNYTDLYGGADAEERFKLSLLSDDVPDIILTHTLDNPDIYMDKNVFTDLYPLMEQAGISKDDYLPGVLAAGSEDGKLNMFIPKFYLSGTGMVKEEYLDGRDGLSVRDMKNLETMHGIEGQGVYQTYRELLLSEAVLYDRNDYYDVKNGECRFDSDEFKELLEWTSRYPSLEDIQGQIVSNELDADVFRKNESIYYPLAVHGFREFNKCDLTFFDGQAVLIGFPNKNGTGKGVIKPVFSLAISSECEEPQAAFEFIRYFMENEYQTFKADSPYNEGFPCKKSCFAEMAEEALEDKDEHIINSRGEKVKAAPISEEKLKAVKTFIEECDVLYNEDDRIGNIIGEEAGAYFAGSKGVDETVDMIQNRANNYVREQQQSLH